MNKKCSFCEDHCKEDTLYNMYYNDGGYIFEPINDIKFCPLCGKELQEDT